jgi:hypothetical protein
MLSCGVAIEFISAERSASKETVLLAPAFLPSVKSPSVQRLLAAQPVTSRREQAWTEHQWLGRDVALHTVAKAAEAFGNQGDYWRHGFLLRGHHDVQVSMRWEASTAGSFGGRIVLYATGAAGAGKTTLVKEVVHVLESGHSFPRDAKWTWEDLRDADAGSATPRSEPPDKGGGGDHQHTPIPEATALDAGFSKATRPTLQEHSPVWVGFSYKGKAGDDPAKELSKGERATRALRQALEASAAKLNFLLIDYQRPQEHPFQNTGRLIEALSRYSSISIAFMEKEYWGSANCLAEAAMLYEADPAGIFDKNKQQIVRLDDTRCICDPKSDDYQERLDAIVGEAQKWYAREHDAREKRRTGAGTEHVAAHPQWPWIKIALNHEQLDKFNCALNRADATSTLPATSDEATVNEWAKKHAAWVVGLLTGK